MARNQSRPFGVGFWRYCGWRGRDSALLDLLKRNLKIAVPAGIVLVAVGAWLAFGVFGIHTLFIDDKVDEAVPTFEAGSASGIASDEITAELAEEMNETMIETETPSEVRVEESKDEAMDQMDDAVETVVMGSFIDRSHPTSGTALVLGDGSGQRFLRFEGFETDNGPDLNVYLSTAPPDAEAGDFDEDFVDLGDLKGNIGDQNYEIPASVDLAKYQTVVIWCVRFSVAFGAAPLA